MHPGEGQVGPGARTSPCWRYRLYPTVHRLGVPLHDHAHGVTFEQVHSQPVVLRGQSMLDGLASEHPPFTSALAAGLGVPVGGALMLCTSMSISPSFPQAIFLQSLDHAA
jgi:hypothetical protein